MKLIVGLGNPGEKYHNNRHNVGFMFVDYLLETINELKNSRINEFKFNKYLQSEICEIPPVPSALHPTPYTLHPIIIAKPQTFMNRSGRAVSKLIENWKLKIENLIVVHDDLDIPLGKFKIQKGTGPQLHNGIDSINANLKTHDYLRVRIGVDNRPLENRMNGETYVLQDFSDEEITIINQQVFPIIYSQLQTNKQL